MRSKPRSRAVSESKATTASKRRSFACAGSPTGVWGSSRPSSGKSCASSRRAAPSSLASRSVSWRDEAALAAMRREQRLFEDEELLLSPDQGGAEDATCHDAILPALHAMVAIFLR